MEENYKEQPKVAVDGTEHTVSTAGNKNFTPKTNINTNLISEITEGGLIPKQTQIERTRGKVRQRVGKNTTNGIRIFL